MERGSVRVKHYEGDSGKGEGQGEALCNELETMGECAHLCDRVSTGGGYVDAVTARV